MMKTTLEPSEDKTTKQRRQSAEPETGPQATGSLAPQENVLSQRIADSPAMTAQRKVIESITAAADPIQKQGPEEEELMQGKFITQRQLPEEEELMQGAFEADAPRSTPSDTR